MVGTGLAAFLGANVRDGHPFLLMPLCMHGNALQFLSNNPDVDRIRIVSLERAHYHSLLTISCTHFLCKLRDVAAGLYYLHFRPTPIIHGDLKAVSTIHSHVKQ